MVQKPNIYLDDSFGFYQILTSSISHISFDSMATGLKMLFLMHFYVPYFIILTNLH